MTLCRYLLFAALMTLCLTTSTNLTISQALGQNAKSLDQWNQFRGPGGQGHATASGLPNKFDETTNVVWKTSLDGRGWSSPIVVEDQIWLTTAIETLATGEERERKMATAEIGGMSAYSKVRLQAICLDRNTGSVLRTIDLFEIQDPPLIHSLNSFASPTPVANKSRVFFHFGTFGTACVDRTSGDIIWKNQETSLDHETGPGSSPILWNNRLIFHCDGCDQQYVVALDVDTGKELWRQTRSGEMDERGSFKKAFSTPIIIQRGDSYEMISPAANWVYGYDPDSGEELWKINYGQLGFSNVARPVHKDNTVYVCSCFMRSKLLAIDTTGDQPLDESKIKWSFAR